MDDVLESDGKKKKKNWMATDAKKTDHAQEQNITLPMDTSTL